MAKKKSFEKEADSFINNPAMQFISTAGATEKKEPVKSAPPARKKAPEGYKLNPEYVETKSKRVQLLVQPSIYEAVKAKASSIGISTNEAINEALKAYVQE